MAREELHQRTVDALSIPTPTMSEKKKAGKSGRSVRDFRVCWAAAWGPKKLPSVRITGAQLQFGLPWGVESALGQVNATAIAGSLLERHASTWRGEKAKTRPETATTA